MSGHGLLWTRLDGSPVGRSLRSKPSRPRRRPPPPGPRPPPVPPPRPLPPPRPPLTPPPGPPPWPPPRLPPGPPPGPPRPPGTPPGTPGPPRTGGSAPTSKAHPSHPSSPSTGRRPPVSDLTDSTLFKVLDGLSPVHGISRYPGVGRWTKHLDPARLHPCVFGYPLARGPQVLGWLGPTLYVAEACPDHPPVDDGNKLVTCRVRLVRRFDRWNDVTARLFAADCAEAALLGERASGREPDERAWAA